MFNAPLPFKSTQWQEPHPFFSLAFNTTFGQQQNFLDSNTQKDKLDRSVLPLLLEQTEAEIEAVCADGAYDFAVCYQAIKEKEARPLIPPRSDAIVRNKSPFEQRDENLREIRLRGKRRWKKESGYHNRSLVETAFFRLKTIFTDKLKARTAERQKVEATIRCLALNRMTALGMPQSYVV